MNRKMIGEAICIRVLDKKIKSDSHKALNYAKVEMRRKIRCFAYDKRSDVQRQQQDVNSRRTAEESRTNIYVINELH